MSTQQPESAASWRQTAELYRQTAELFGDVPHLRFRALADAAECEARAAKLEAVSTQPRKDPTT